MIHYILIFLSDRRVYQTR